MKTILGSLYHNFALGNKMHMLWCAGVLLIMLMLAILHHKWRNDDKKLRIWRVLCVLPLIVCAVHAVLTLGGIPFWMDLLPAFISMYAIALFALLMIPFAKRKIGYPIMATLVGILTVLCGFYSLAQAPNLKNAARESYTDSFRSLVAFMDEKYVLKEWKEIDFPALEAKYLPLVQEAEQANDPSKFEEAVIKFCNELHDGHVSVSAVYDHDIYSNSAFRQYEYGLAMVKLDNGDVIAVCTDEKVHDLGIQDGTKITKWNGKPVLQAAAEDVAAMSVPVQTNIDFLAVMNLSNLGGNDVEVSFIDESGAEKTVTLQTMGERHTLNEAFKAFNQGPIITTNEEYEAFFKENFTTRMLNDKCGYLKLIAEDTGNGVQDIIGYLRGNHTWAREKFREKLNDLKSQGMEYLVVDLRNNMGGMDEIGCALCDLLTTEDWYGQGLGIRKNGKYTCVSDHGIHGTGEFADLQVVALTNYNCVSAGDGTSLYLSKLPNVTLAGITDPCGCNQETGGYCVLSKGCVSVSFPTGLILNEDGEPNVDTRADLITRNPVEVRIPFDCDAAMRIFHDKQDYELDWAINYLEQNAASAK